jgi:ABC-type branched-subunit amino acid transport system ATPase component
MVEHALQGEDASLSILDFIASGGYISRCVNQSLMVPPFAFRVVDPQLANVSREAIAAQLREVGFDDERQAHTVGSLSGGWKMKLELARAMLYKADLLMLDEPTNHVSSIVYLHYRRFLERFRSQGGAAGSRGVFVRGPSIGGGCLGMPISGKDGCES